MALAIYAAVAAFSGRLAAAFFTVFAALFGTAVLLAVFACPALAALTAADRFVRGLGNSFSPSSRELTLRFGDSALTGAGCSNSPRIFAHLAFLASLILRNVAALSLFRLRPAGSGLSAVSVELRVVSSE